MTAILASRSGERHLYSVFRTHDEFGLVEYDLAAPPLRFFSGVDPMPPVVRVGEDARATRQVPTPADILGRIDLGTGDNWQAQTRRSLNRLRAWFLVCEDPQRRFESREIQTLAHQASLVRHILENDGLQRVLIADEVGLGKTIEAGLVIKELLEQQPGLRVLYFAPARLVPNVSKEFKRLGLHFRQWRSGEESDANLREDPRVVASIHKAAIENNFERVLQMPSWDVLIVDECHHLSNYGPEGDKPVRQYALVQKLIEKRPDARLVLMSGTPHQGNPDRFNNLLRLLYAPGEGEQALAGRVIYRTKEDVCGWHGEPLFPKRDVRTPRTIPLVPDYKRWLEHIHDFYVPDEGGGGGGQARRRAVGWRCAQALQWAASSVQAGLGYLVRQAIRLGWGSESTDLSAALAAIRPYRLGPSDEPIVSLFRRISQEVARQMGSDDVEDIEEFVDDRWTADRVLLSRLLREGVDLLGQVGDSKWEFLWREVIVPAGTEQVVLFAQPIETVTSLANYLERRTGERPALIVGGQTDDDRNKQVERLWARQARFLVSSRAGSEGINLQCAHRVVHVDVPWNPMEMEQRVGRVHRFGSEQTIVVDTIVLKDTREERAYAVAHEKLRAISESLTTDTERFAELFARVMSLVAPADLQEIMASSAVGPLSPDDEREVAALVQEGFERWRSFDERFHARRQMDSPNPGLATWSDLQEFVTEQAKAAPVPGFSALRFEHRDGRRVESSRDRISVLELPGGKLVACSDIGGRPIVNDDGKPASVVAAGLNLPPIAQALRAAAFPELPSGAAHLRWSARDARPSIIPPGTNGVLAIARLALQRDEQSAWTQQDATLHLHSVLPGGEPTEITGEAAGELVRAILAASVRAKAEPEPRLLETLQRVERDLIDRYRRTADADVSSGRRYAVFPLLAAIVSEAT